jgi:hypothetical protein
VVPVTHGVGLAQGPALPQDAVTDGAAHRRERRRHLRHAEVGVDAAPALGAAHAALAAAAALQLDHPARAAGRGRRRAEEEGRGGAVVAARHRERRDVEIDTLQIGAAGEPARGGRRAAVEHVADRQRRPGVGRGVGQVTAIDVAGVGGGRFDVAAGANRGEDEERDEDERNRVIPDSHGPA